MFKAIASPEQLALMKDIDRSRAEINQMTENLRALRLARGNGSFFTSEPFSSDELKAYADLDSNQ